MSSAAFTLKPSVAQVTKQFAATKLQKMAQSTAKPVAKVSTTVQNIHGKSGRKCMLTGKKANNGWTVSFSHIRNKKLQGVNLQYKRVFWPEQNRYVRLRISTKALKTIQKKGLEAMAAEAGLDLMSLPYIDADPKRKEWLVENGAPPEKKDKRAPTGKPKKLFIPKWKEERMAKKGQDKAAETKAFAEKWGMEVV